MYRQNMGHHADTHYVFIMLADFDASQQFFTHMLSAERVSRQLRGKQSSFKLNYKCPVPRLWSAIEHKYTPSRLTSGM
jgi:hypothetical protein